MPCARAGSGCPRTEPRPQRPPATKDIRMTDTATDATSGADPLPPPADLAQLSTRPDGEAARLDRELGEVDLLITQAKTEALRHETRRSGAADKLAAAPREGDRGELIDLTNQVVNLTRRAALMESQ